MGRRRRREKEGGRGDGGMGEDYGRDESLYGLHSAGVHGMGWEALKDASGSFTPFATKNDINIFNSQATYRTISDTCSCIHVQISKTQTSTMLKHHAWEK